MARYDEHTQHFMDDVREDPKPDSVSAAKKAISAVNALASGQSVPRIATKELVKALVKESEEGPRVLPPLELYSLLNGRFGNEWHDWEPETLWHMIGESLPLVQINKDRVLALQVLVNTNYAFEHWHIFEKVGRALAGNHVDFGTLQPLEPDQCALAAKVLGAIRPHVKFDPEVLAYMAACANQAGLAAMPEDLFPEGCERELMHIVGDHFNTILEQSALRSWKDHASEHEDSPLGVQLAKFTEIKDYVEKGMAHA